MSMIGQINKNITNLLEKQVTILPSHIHEGKPDIVCTKWNSHKLFILIYFLKIDNTKGAHKRNGNNDIYVWNSISNLTKWDYKYSTHVNKQLDSLGASFDHLDKKFMAIFDDEFRSKSDVCRRLGQSLQWLWNVLWVLRMQCIIQTLGWFTLLWCEL